MSKDNAAVQMVELSDGRTVPALPVGGHVVPLDGVVELADLVLVHVNREQMSGQMLFACTDPAVPQARVVARVGMSLETMRRVHQMLTGVLEAAAAVAQPPAQA